jgi:hypothetical protein
MNEVTASRVPRLATEWGPSSPKVEQLRSTESGTA